VNGMVAMQMMMGGGNSSDCGDSSGGMMGMMMKGRECAAKAQGDCSGDCEWGPDDDGKEECSVNGMVAMQMMMGDGMAEDGLYMKSATCAMKSSQNECTDECLWSAEDNTCSVAPNVIFTTMFGDRTEFDECHSALSEVYDSSYVCSMLSASECDTDQCAWNGEGHPPETCNVREEYYYRVIAANDGVFNAGVETLSRCQTVSKKACDGKKIKVGTYYEAGEEFEVSTAEVKTDLKGDILKGGLDESEKQAIVAAFKEANGFGAGDEVVIKEVKQFIESGVGLAGVTTDDWTDALETSFISAFATTNGVNENDVTVTGVTATGGSGRHRRSLLQSGGIDVAVKVAVDDSNADAVESSMSDSVSDGSLLAATQEAGVPATGAATTVAPTKVAEVVMEAKTKVSLDTSELATGAELSTSLANQGVAASAEVKATSVATAKEVQPETTKLASSSTWTKTKVFPTSAASPAWATTLVALATAFAVAL